MTDDRREPSWPPDPGWPLDLDWPKAEALAIAGMERLRERDPETARRLSDYVGEEQRAQRTVKLTVDRSPDGSLALGLQGVELWRGLYADVRRRLDA